MKRTIILIFAIWLISAPYIYGATPIMGDTELSVERMYQFVKSRNNDFQREIAETFHRVGNRYGIRGDIALCQAILETGWFRFSDGTAVDGQ
ncbi:MAG: glucosaminidase domain-containing protein, partial [Muribaculaceae bacterium]|nr:glucosaminidase domain-containing protein [Muribaculaceae bacterium]